MKEQFKEIEIPFGAKDSELCGWEYTIPEGMEATIIDNKIVVKKKECEDEQIRKDIVFYIAANHKDDGEKARWLYWLEKQGKQELTVIIPKFKAGQTIKYIGDFTIYPEVFTVSKVGEAHYLDKNGFTIPIKNQDQWELVEQNPTDWSSEQSKTLQTDDVPNESSTAAPLRTGAIGFDGEPMESKPCEQKPAEKTTWYDNMDDLIADAMIDDIKNADMPEHCKHNRLTWINKHRSKSTEWSDEDEEQFSFCCAAIELSNYSSDEYRNYAISFLESLKDRVQPQPKQEWKPSEEQMENLSRAFNGGTFQTSLLMELYQDLKKLMEE